MAETITLSALIVLLVVISYVSSEKFHKTSHSIYHAWDFSWQKGRSIIKVNDCGTLTDIVGNVLPTDFILRKIDTGPGL